MVWPQQTGLSSEGKRQQDHPVINPNAEEIKTQIVVSYIYCGGICSIEGVTSAHSLAKLSFSSEMRWLSYHMLW